MSAVLLREVSFVLDERSFFELVHIVEGIWEAIRSSVRLSGLHIQGTISCYLLRLNGVLVGLAFTETKLAASNKATVVATMLTASQQMREYDGR